MKDKLTYKGYIGSVHFSAGDKVFFGKVEGIADLVTFEGRIVDELIEAFKAEVNDYIALCKEVGKRPEKSYKGSFNVRIPADLHKKAMHRATLRGVSLNQLVQQAIEHEVG
jgi:predicted HicB family RNase H-like nuclease